MTRTLATLTAALCLTASAAFAGPTVMTDEQMDSQVAGATIQTKSGKVVWTVTSLDPLEGYNNGGNGKTERASRGLLNAVSRGGLMLMD